MTDKYKTNYPNIPWRAIKGMRNRIVHEYGGADLETVFKTVKEDIPDLLKQLTDEI